MKTIILSLFLLTAHSCGRRVAVSFAKDFLWFDSVGYLPVFLVLCVAAIVKRNWIAKFLGS